MDSAEIVVQEVKGQVVFVVAHFLLKAFVRRELCLFIWPLLNARIANKRQRAGVKLSEWMRQRLIKAAKRRIQTELTERWVTIPSAQT